MKERNKDAEKLSVMQELVCDSLIAVGAVQFGDFWLNLHQYSPSAPKSPIYVDMRVLRRFPEGTKLGAKEVTLTAYEEAISKLDFDLLADVPTGSTFLVSSLSDRLRTGMVSPRLGEKKYGSGTKVDGFLEEDRGKNVLLIDDVLTRGSSIIRAASVLRSVGLLVKDVVVLLDREQGGKDELEKVGLELHSVLTLDKMLLHYVKSGELNLDKYHEIKTRLEGLSRIM